MRSTTANYDTENAKASKKRVGIVEFDSITTKFSSQTFKNISGNHKKGYIKQLFLDVPTIDLLYDPMPGASQIQAEIVDKSLDMTTVLKDNAMRDRGVTLKIGFQQIDDTDFVSLKTLSIERVDLGGEYLSYIVNARDTRRKLKQDLFRDPAEDALNGAITSSATTLTLDDATKFVDPASLILPKNGIVNKFTPCVKIGAEIIQYTAISGNNLTSLTRGKFQTTAVAHNDNDIVTQLYVFNDLLWTELVLFLFMTTSDASGHDYYDLAKVDTAFKNMGLGLTISEVDVEKTERLGYEIQHHEAVTLGSDKRVNSHSWLVDNVIFPNAGYIFEDNTGKLVADSYEFVHVNEKFTAVDTLTDSDIQSATLQQRDDWLINHFRFNYTAGLSGLPGFSQDFKLDESVTDYGQTETIFEVNKPIIAIDFARRLKWEASKWLYFFGNVPGTVTIQTKFEKWLLEQGDYANMTFAKLPDMIGGTRGWTNKKHLVLGQQARFIGGDEFQLEMITWELYNRVTNFFTKTTVNEGSITRTALTLNADKTATLNAEDAYHDFGSTITPDMIIATIELIPPNSGTTHHSIGLNFHSQENVASVYTDRGTRDLPNVRYFSGDSVAFQFDVMWIVGEPNNVDRVKVDFYQKTAGPTETPTLKLVKIRAITFNQNITIL